MDEVVAWRDGAGAGALLEEDVVVGFGQEVEEGFVEEVGGDVGWDVGCDGVGTRGQLRPEVGQRVSAGKEGSVAGEEGIAGSSGLGCRRG